MPANLQQLSNPRLAMPIKIIAVYIGWKVFHHFTQQPGTWLYIQWQNLCVAVGSFYATFTVWLLQLFGMQVSADGININLLQYNKQIWVQEHCLAIPAMVVFTGTVLLIKSPTMQKIWFIPAGLAGIVLINTLRLIFVSLAWVHLSHQFFNLHHSFIYTAITYGFIFLMLIWWINRNVEYNSEAA